MKTTIDALVEALNGFEVAKGWLQVSDREHAVGCLAKYITSAEAALAQARAEQAEPVFIVATGETHNGMETYTRHDSPPPLSEFERLYTTTTPPAAPVAELEPLTPRSPISLFSCEMNMFKLGWLEAEAAHNAKLGGGG